MERNLLVFFALFLSFSASSCSAYFFGDADYLEALATAPTDADYLEALATAPTDGARVYIVTVEWHKGLETKQFAIKTLTSVLGSEVAAEKALVYVYDYVFPGFAAKLTPSEALKLKKQPGIHDVIPDTTYRLIPLMN